MSKLQKVQKKKLSHSHAVSNTAKFLQTRPFAEIGDSTKSLQTQLVEASNLRHNFGDLQVQPNSSPVVQPKLTIGEPGDKYEQEADKNKTQINQKSGISSIQRDLINENAKDQINGLDTVYELIAHKIAYKGIDGIPGTMGDWLDAQGYQRNWLGTVRGTGLFCGLIMPKNGSDKKPVLAFKGTEPSKTGDLLADVDPIAVGFTAFKLKQNQIQGLINQAREAGWEKVVVTGHSLGGALAQHAASAFTGSISKVVTFQAPGISQEQVRQFNNNVNQMEERQRPEVVHHLATGDIVDLAGGKHIGGSGLYTGKGNAQFYLHHLESSGPRNHTKFLLQDREQEQLGLKDSNIGKTQKVGLYDDNPFAGNQFIFERGREFAAPGVALGLGGKVLAQQGLKNWRQGGTWNKTKGVGKMIGGGLAGVVGGLGAVGGGLIGATGGTLAVGVHKTVKGLGEGLSTGIKLGTSPGKALVRGGVGLAKEGIDNWRQGGIWNKTKGVGKIIGGGITTGVGGLTTRFGGLIGGTVGAITGGITGIPRSLWRRWKRK